MDTQPSKLSRRLLGLRNAVFERARGHPPLEVLVARGLQIGERAAVMRPILLDPSHPHLISIGDDVTLAPGVIVLAHDASTKLHLGYARIAKVRIGNRVFVGTGSIVLPGVTIGDDAIVGAGSVVTRDVAAGTVVAGNPAGTLTSTGDYIERHRRRLHVAPTYPRDGFTYRVGMPRENRERMATEISREPGYVQ